MAEPGWYDRGGTLPPGSTIRSPGDFAVCRIGGIGGIAIDFGEWLNGAKAFSHWDHALIYVDHGYCLQAEPGGAQIIDRPVLPGDLWSTGIPSLALSQAQQYMVPAVAETFRGTGYSWLDYGALAARRLHFPDWPVWPDDGKRVTLRKFIGSEHHWMCSALVDHVRARLGSHLFDDGRFEGYVTPYDLGQLIERAAGA
jgi:hypothetical protein